MTAECCESCRPIDLVGPKGYEHGWRYVGPNPQTEIRTAGKVRKGHYITIREKPYKVTGALKNRHDPALVDLHLQAEEDIGVRQRVITVHRERHALPVIQFANAPPLEPPKA